jgi:hypothetical protein
LILLRMADSGRTRRESLADENGPGFGWVPPLVDRSFAN